MSYVPLDGSKTCRRCLVEKPVTDFRVFRTYGAADRAYRRCWCLECERAYTREWRLRNPGYHADWSRRYRAMTA